jgi:uncharacterized protein (DUF433 family)
MLDIRNKAAHDEVLSRDEAQQRGHGQCKSWSKYSACVLYVRLWRQKDKSMAKQYVEQRENVYWVAGTRVSLDSIVYAFLEGQTAESIAQSFPVLTLEQVYGAITFYLANRPDIDAYLCREEAEFETLRQAWRTQDAMFYQKMADARRQGQTIQP